MQTLKFKNLRLKHTKQSHKPKWIVFIIIYNHYELKFSELKNQVPKLRV
jgi:hypothetical protein